MICNHANYTKGCRWCEQRLIDEHGIIPKVKITLPEKLNSIEIRKARKDGLYDEQPLVHPKSKDSANIVMLCVFLAIFLVTLIYIFGQPVK